MHIVRRTHAQAPADRIFRFYEDVANWPAWDPDTRAARLDGPLQPGARGSLTPTRGRTVPMLVTAVVPGRSFTVECRIPLFRMVFEHELLPMDGGTEITHRVHFHGLLSILLGPMLIRQLRTGLPVTLERLRQRAEAAGA